jgi:hypothetical protein
MLQATRSFFGLGNTSIAPEAHILCSVEYDVGYACKLVPAQALLQ